MRCLTSPRHPSASGRPSNGGRSSRGGSATPSGCACSRPNALASAPRIEVLNRVLHVPLFTEQLEVVAWEPPRTMAMAHRSFVRGTGTWALEPVDGSTRFTWTEELSLPIPVLGEPALLVYRPFLRGQMRRSLANLQRLVASA